MSPLRVRLCCRKNRSRVLATAVAFLAAIAPASNAATLYVSVEGQDAEDRDGRSPETAWASLAYACERTPAGEHLIQLGSGTFVAERTAHAKDGVTIAGRGHEGDNATRIVASATWNLSEDPNSGNPVDEYLLFLQKAKNVTIRNLALGSKPEHRITGALLCRGSEDIIIHDLHVHDFRWAGLAFEGTTRLNVHDCTIENASTEKHRYHNGLIQTRWIKQSEIHHNQIVSSEGGGYGYKGSGHRGVRLHHNYIDIGGGFAIESAHENEFGLEIDHNYLTRCISVPKSGQGADPTKEGHDYSVWIHHNILTDSNPSRGREIIFD